MHEYNWKHAVYFLVADKIEEQEWKLEAQQNRASIDDDRFHNETAIIKKVGDLDTAHQWSYHQIPYKFDRMFF